VDPVTQFCRAKAAIFLDFLQNAPVEGIRPAGFGEGCVMEKMLQPMLAISSLTLHMRNGANDECQVKEWCKYFAQRRPLSLSLQTIFPSKALFSGFR
jgi:hypothetical protein